ncbi:hypothetical protein SAMN05443428_10935 [Caloramator quimbayensis]|uniref:Uncharacterized protein n=1 Tax=Caloramator quimbayensis TaxID=1147123 RepID=A0A1T4XH24_9CLOT|nr:hypothetical protein [Caloramator quimbayensis]SKA88793.1 hypothetical protein SAMN05443428_10935 [Caloramator quimbayensis]
MRKNILIVFIVIMALIAFPLSLAFSKGGYKFVPKTENADILGEIAKAYNKEGNIEISEELINNIMTQAFKKPFNKGIISIEDCYFYIDGENINVCLKSSYKGKNFYPNISAKLDYSDKGLIAYVSKFKLGNLALPKSILINSIKEYSNDYFKVVEDKIIISNNFVPFNVNKIYIKDKKIVIELKKDLKISNNNEKENEKTAKNINTNQSSIPKNNKNSQSSTSKSNSLQSNKTNVNSAADESKKLLYLVKSQLNGAISSVKTSKEKKILQTIQNVVGEVAKNPSYPYKSEAGKVISDYKSLNPEEKERVKKAILNNVDTKNVIKLISIFGL